ncbi:MAG: hypothetical protein JW770_00710 [Actinobacteria bacterium]|nr:hypothetical protein [Actinomycetota bacterium]
MKPFIKFIGKLVLLPEAEPLSGSFARKLRVFLKNTSKTVSLRWPVAAFLLMSFLMPALIPLVSCRPAAEFSELYICSSVDEENFSPVNVTGQFDIEAESIYATINVSGVKPGDTWRFTWKNTGTGFVLADAANVYSTGETRYMEGYLSHKLVPHGSDPIIGEPGNYVVEFYHNSELKASSLFTIKEPLAKVKDVIFSGGIDKEGKPSGQKTMFYQDETVFVFVELDYRIPGDLVELQWYGNGGELSGKSSYTVNEGCYFPGYVIFEIYNEIPWPIGDYRVEIIHNGIKSAGEVFETKPYDYMGEAVNEATVYENTGYGFRINYPRSWSFEEGEEESGLRVRFYPDKPEKDFVVYMWVYKDGYYPGQNELSGFSDNLLQGVIESGSGEKPDIKKKESEGKIGDVPFKEIEYSYYLQDKTEYWNAAFSYILHNKKMYVLFRVSSNDYLKYASEACMDMRNSIEFIE